MKQPWLGVVLASALICTAIDCAVLQRRFAIFSGGFLNPYSLQGPKLAFFLLGSLWIDTAVSLLFLVPALWIAGCCRFLARPGRLLLAALLCALPVQWATVQRFDVAVYVGDFIQWRLFPGSNGSFEPLGMATLALLALLVAAFCFWLLRLMPRVAALLGTGSRTRRRAFAAGALVVVSAVAMVLVTGLVSVSMQLAFEHKTAGRWLILSSDRLTDLDGDDYGLVRQPTDQAPFDGRRHPFAVDLPGNGVDENGVCGDLDGPGDFAFERYGPVKFARRPDLLLFVLESFRGDNLRMLLGGRPVAPTLRRLIDEGAISGPAYSHNGYTAESLSHLFGGTVSLMPAGSIIDDFNANGYFTAIVSGEDEGFSGIKQETGMERADLVLDARKFVAERSSTGSTPGSLNLPWTVVVRNLERVLKTRAQPGRPVFAYVNFQDCHYPYHHAAMEPLLNHDPVGRSEITPGNRERVRRTYLNAAANVDRAVGRVLEAWERVRGRRPAFVVVGDHGESIFGDGILGHGMRLNAEQTEIPFIVGGLDVECVFPAGLADVRGMLRRALLGERQSTAAILDPQRWVFQYTGKIRGPRLLGAAFADGGLTFNLRSRQPGSWGKPPADATPDPVRLWEQIVLHRASH